MSWYRWEDGVLWLSLRVQPRARRDAFVAPHGEHYRVQITAPPVDDKANAHLRRFLAVTFGVPLAQVLLVAGLKARTKQVRVIAPNRLPAFLPTPGECR